MGLVGVDAVSDEAPCGGAPFALSGHVGPKQSGHLGENGGVLDLRRQALSGA